MKLGAQSMQMKIQGATVIYNLKQDRQDCPHYNQSWKDHNYGLFHVQLL